MDHMSILYKQILLPSFIKDYTKRKIVFTSCSPVSQCCTYGSGRIRVIVHRIWIQSVPLLHYCTYDSYIFHEVGSGFFSRRSDPAPVFCLGYIRIRSKHLQNLSVSLLSNYNKKIRYMNY